MNISIYLGFVLGGIIGGVFAWLQLMALHRNEMLERKEQVQTLLRQIPGSASRCAFLLMSFILAQMVFPSASVVWMASGVAVAYAIPFVFRLRVKYLHR